MEGFSREEPKTLDKIDFKSELKNELIRRMDREIPFGTDGMREDEGDDSFLREQRTLGETHVIRILSAIR